MFDYHAGDLAPFNRGRVHNGGVVRVFFPAIEINGIFGETHRTISGTERDFWRYRRVFCDDEDLLRHVSADVLDDIYDI